MTPADLRRYGEALYGPRWQSELARALDVSGRTVRYWLAGTHPIPDGVQSEIRRIVSSKLRELREIR
jgi:DNA-binding transcriptional regulator YiaG